jgi:hypothetical protein
VSKTGSYSNLKSRDSLLAFTQAETIASTEEANLLPSKRKTRKDLALPIVWLICLPPENLKQGRRSIQT